MKLLTRNLALFTICAATGAAAANSAFGAEAPLGIWVDEDGRGAVEVRMCGNTLCGFVVWVRDPKDRHGCGQQLMGNVMKTSSGWDYGWIASPDDGQKYSVALEPLSRNTVRVIGYAGSKLFSKSMIWTRVNGKIERCDEPAATPRAITASVQTKPSVTATKHNARVVKASVAKSEPPATGPRYAPAPERKPIIVASLEPEIIAPAPILAQRPNRELPPPMALGRGPDTAPGELADQKAAGDNDCGLRAIFLALFGSSCTKK